MHLLSKWHRENQGLTIVEVICAVAIFSLIGATICSVMIVSARNYQKDTNEIELQQEAQLTANQIQDILLDANDASVVGPQLRVIKGNRQYTITYLSASNQLVYGEKIISPETFIVTNQVMAENVSTFSVDDTNFLSNRSLTLNLSLSKNDRSFSSSYTISSRNREPVSSGDFEAVALSVDEPEIVLEPSEVYPLKATVTGTSDTSVSWSMTGNTSGATIVYPDASDGGKWKIKIGTDETASELNLTVKTNVKRADGITPEDDGTMTVYVRRVTNIVFTPEAPILISGTPKQLGAVYRLNVMVTGYNLDERAFAKDTTSYVNPYTVDWTVIPYVNGVADANWNNYVQFITTSDAYLTIRLKKTIDASISLKFIATAKHPQGVNRSGILYGDVKDECMIYPSYHTFDGGLVYRGTDFQQGYIDISALKKKVLDKHHIETDQVGREYRFREILSENEVTHERVCGSWSSWAPMSAEAGNSLNLRPEETYRFEFNKDYEIQIRYFMYKDNINNKLWPFTDTEANVNLIDAEIKRIKIYFDSVQLGLSKACTCGSKDAPFVVACNNNIDLKLFIQSAVEWGYDFTRNQNCLMFKVEKLSGDTWTDASTSDYSQNLQDYSKAQNIKFLNPGTYRVIVGLKNVPYRIYNEATHTGTTVNKNYWLGNEDTGDCIYYIKAQ